MWAVVNTTTTTMTAESTNAYYVLMNDNSAKGKSMYRTPGGGETPNLSSAETFKYMPATKGIISTEAPSKVYRPTPTCDGDMNSCSGDNGICKNGKCLCNKGFTGKDCSGIACADTCAPPNGTCDAKTGTCACAAGYSGAGCETGPPASKAWVIWLIVGLVLVALVIVFVYYYRNRASGLRKGTGQNRPIELTDLGVP